MEIINYKDKHEFISSKGIRSVLYLMDCMEGLKQIPDKYFGLAIVDPPYGINAPKMSMGTNLNRKGKGQYPGESTAVKIKKGRLNQGSGKLKNRALNTMNCEWDFNPPSSEYFEMLKRASNDQIIWGGNYFPLPPTRCVAVWDKCQPWENFSQVEIAWTSFDKPASIFSLSNTGGSNSEPKIHPTQKPVRLYEWLISKYFMENDFNRHFSFIRSILDTHTGSGSSRIACLKANIPFMGFEISPDYFYASVKRFNEYSAQGTFF